VVLLTGHNGQVVERYEYDAYGAAYNGKFDRGLAGMGGNPYGFTGKRYETEIGIYSFAFRDYNPRTMRWLTPDPVMDGLNWYLYCGGDPVNWIDPLGLCGEKPEGWVMPVDNPVVRAVVGEYGAARKQETTYHKGVDFLGDVGDPVKAAKSGKVVVAQAVGDYGNVVYIDHDDGLSTRYAHLDRIDVKVGDIVETGQQIGAMGRTGNVTTEPTHLHFEVRKIREGATGVRNIDTVDVNPNEVLPIDSLPKQ